MMYKLTDQNMMTYNDCQWVVGEWKTARGKKDNDLCSDGWIHAYEHPLLAVLFNCIHADIENPRLWEAQTGKTIKRNGQVKCGARKLRLVREMPMPVITTEQRVRFAIYCTQAVYKDHKWTQWANDWLSGKNRTTAAAAAAAAAAEAERARAAAWAERAWAAARAGAAAEAAAAAAAAAEAANRAAGGEMNLIEIAEKAVKP